MVALCIYGIGRIVVKVVYGSSETVVEEHVKAGIVVGGVAVFRLSHVYATSADDGYAPQVAFDIVSGDGCCLCLVRVVDVDAASAVVWVCLVVVADDGVVLYYGCLFTICGQSETVVSYLVVFDECVEFSGQSYKV